MCRKTWFAHHDFQHGSAPHGASRLRASMNNNNRISTIGLVVCVVLSTTMVAMVFLIDAADAQWHGLFGVLVQRVAAAFTTAPTLTSAGSDRAELAGNLYLAGYAAGCMLFSLLFWLRTTSGDRRPGWINALILAAQLLIGVTVESNLLYIFAAELGLVLPLRRAIGWFLALAASHVAQSLMIVAAAARSDRSAQYGLLAIGAELVFCMFSFGVASLAMLEQRARIKLSAAHAELQATQALLADTVRTSERLRIARDLHDSIGHHLTALNLHLDLADRQLGGSNASVHTARELSRSLLSEVRVVVSSERGGQYIDLRQSLQTLCDGIPTPTIQLQVDDDVRIDSALTAHTLFRCIQEAISNAVRHAAASLLTIHVRRQGASVGATIRDDGRGALGRAEGNGLTGMRERLQALGGALSSGDLPQGGFQVDLSLPLAEAPR
jgi:signal transduction histidine kinase